MQDNLGQMVMLVFKEPLVKLDSQVPLDSLEIRVSKEPKARPVKLECKVG